MTNMTVSLQLDAKLQPIYRYHLRCRTQQEVYVREHFGIVEIQLFQMLSTRLRTSYYVYCREKKK